MNLEQFYNIVHTEKNENILLAQVKLVIDHPIYKGHFPDQPVLPGIMQIEMIADLINHELNTQYQLKKASNIKYLNMIIPNNETIVFEIKYSVQEDGDLKVNCVIKDENTIFTKFSGFFN
jgi:3-hydroxyacyl-[acyl-carrier-protein] dehydratase